MSILRPKKEIMTLFSRDLTETEKESEREGEGKAGVGEKSARKEKLGEVVGIGKSWASFTPSCHGLT